MLEQLYINKLGYKIDKLKNLNAPVNNNPQQSSLF
jgi:hypothetical protein